MREPTMEEYMTKIRDDYESGIARPKINNKDHFELKEVILFYKGLDVPTRQILDSKGVVPSMKATDAKKGIQYMADYSKKWHNGTSTRGRSTDTSNGLAAIQAQLNNIGREIKKVNERVYAAQVRYRAAALGFYQMYNANPSYQERRQTREESLRKFMAEYAKRHDKNSNLINKIQAAADAAIRNQGASIKTLDIQIRKLIQVLQERGSRSLPGSTKTTSRDHVKSISTIIETQFFSICRIGPTQYAISTQQNKKQIFKRNHSTIPFLSRLTNDYDEMDLLDSAAYIKSFLKEKPRMGYQMETSTYMSDSGILKATLPIKEKGPGSFTLPCYINDICFEKALADLGASKIKCPNGVAENVLVGIDKFVFPVDFVVLDMPEDIKIALKIGNDKIMLKSEKPTSNIIKRVYALGLREWMELDLESRLMGEASILNRSLDHVYGDYIKLNDLNEPLEHRRNQVEDLGPTIEDGEVIDKPMIKETKTRNDDEESFEHVNANNFLVLSINIMSKKFFNSIMKDKILFEGKNVVGAFINVPIFVGNFSIITDFTVLENMDAYHDEGMGDVIVRKPFCREICIKTKRFD
uniref:Reverse transcriptase domain-containing protein n=1 Tax=Tanacetum cinerariifolium TaxID=118510 RepID=A0A6L2M6N8_TANCI|nr:hypothetical protein [Tanacetum cinerariifolium]